MSKLTTITAQFHGNNATYSYFVPEGDKPKVGDLIFTSVAWEVWPTMDGAPTNQDLVGMARDAKVARIVGIDLEPNPKANKFYVKLLPLEELQAAYVENAKLLKKQKARAEAKSKLEQLLKEQDDVDRFARLAASNSEAAELLKILTE